MTRRPWSDAAKGRADAIEAVFNRLHFGDEVKVDGFRFRLILIAHDSLVVSPVEYAVREGAKIRWKGAQFTIERGGGNNLVLVPDPIIKRKGR